MRRKDIDGQMSIDNYELKQVTVRLKLGEGPSYYSKTPMTNMQDAVQVMQDVLKQLPNEMVVVVNADNHLKPLNFSIISLGSVNASMAPIQNCLRTAILSNSNNIMLFHNHPSGDVEPSEDDESVTKRLSEAAKLMDINLVDHIIVGGETGNLFSFRDNMPWLFVDRDIDYDFIHNMTAESRENVSEKGPGYQAGTDISEALAKRLDDFNYELDPYGYLDTYDNRENGYADMLDAIRSGGIENIAEDMQAKMSDYPEEMKEEAEEIIREINKFSSQNIVSERTTSYKSKTFDPKAAAEARKAEMKDITEKLEKGVEGVFQSDQYKKFLDTMARFPHYSMNNNLLIMLQRPDASLCQSYTGWKQMGRFVKRGERGIRILAPSPYKTHREQDKLDGQGRVIMGKDGLPERESVEVEVTAFKPVSTFDISQTEGDPIPSLGVDELTGSVEGYQTLFEALKRACPVPVEFEDIKTGAKGYFDLTNNRIAIKQGMGEAQNVKTLIHEMTHQKLHSINEKTGKGPEKSRNQKEVEAESTAYTVCQHYGIDTSDYSFGYVAGWSEGKEMPELKASLETICTAASETITSVDEKLEEVRRETEGVLYEYQDGFIDVKKSENDGWKYQIIDSNNVITSTGVMQDAKTAEQAAKQALKTEKGYEGKIFVSSEQETAKIRQAVKENLESVERVCGKMHM